VRFKVTAFCWVGAAYSYLDRPASAGDTIRPAASCRTSATTPLGGSVELGERYEVDLIAVGRHDENQRVLVARESLAKLNPTDRF
jgi:hypothetical protein